MPIAVVKGSGPTIPAYLRTGASLPWICILSVSLSVFAVPPSVAVVWKPGGPAAATTTHENRAPRYGSTI